jgi:hypothetical protein
MLCGGVAVPIGWAGTLRFSRPLKRIIAIMKVFALSI